MNISRIREKLRDGEPLSFDDGVELWRHPNLLDVGALANEVRERLHGDRTYFNRNLHINATNVCVASCMFCSFARLKPGDKDAYTMSHDEAWGKLRTRVDAGDPLTEVHIVNGLHDGLPFDYYEELLRGLKRIKPSIHLKAFTAVELFFFHKHFGMPIRTVLERLRDAGMDSIPGGGAEIFAPKVRKKICDDKCTGDEWLQVHREAHQLGLRSNCTMLYGHIESDEDRVDHLLRLRALQDETGGFQTFIPLAFHPDNNALMRLPGPTGVEDLRMYAVSRLVLHNIPHIKAYWIMLGVKTAQSALWFGADDLDGTVQEEKIYHMAGAETPQVMTPAEIVRLIRNAGRSPVERDTLYNVVAEGDALGGNKPFRRDVRKSLEVVLKRVRVAAVSFLNARPITYGLERGLGDDKFDLSFDLPSRCAAKLASGEVDLALIPTAAYREIEAATPLRAVPGVAIASTGDVRTVLLVGQVPWQSMTDIALDGASRSSAALVRLLSRERGVRPSFVEVPHDQVETAAHGATGALVIGDAGFTVAERYPHVYDLGGEWKRLSGLPFVYAIWAGRPGAVDDAGIALLRESLRLGLAARGEIARAWAEAHGGTPAFYERYLVDNIQYRLGAEEISGAGAFLERLRLDEGSERKSRLRFFDGAYVKETAVRVAMSDVAANDGARPARTVDSLLADAAGGKRLSPQDFMRLYAEARVLDLGAAADARRRALHPDGTVTYIIDRNVNYTNVCVTRCKFCNFYRPPTNKTDGYTLSREILAQKFQETVDLGGVQILLQGGLNPDLPITWYEDLFRWMKANFPLAIHGLSPEEIRYIAELENMPIRAVIERLVAAGLDSIPGGGAEILDDEIRHAISPLKCTTDTWMEVMREGHALGLRTTATMVFGFGETPAHLANHLERLRALQDQTSGFTAFICWPFQAEGTRLKLRDDTTAMRYLRIFALARLYLDNFPSLQVSWPTMGPEVSQVALRFGGNDFGSAMIEENVVSQAGAVFKLSSADIERYVRAAGFIPRRRNMRYELLPTASAA